MSPKPTPQSRHFGSTFSFFFLIFTKVSVHRQRLPHLKCESEGTFSPLPTPGHSRYVTIQPSLMISDSHALSSHLPTPSIPAYTSTHAYAFDTHAYALDTLTLDTARTHSTPSRTPSMPPPPTPRIRFKTLTYTYQCPRPQHPRVHVQHPRARVQHPRACVQHSCAHSLTCTGQMPCILGPRHVCKHASRCRRHGKVGGGADTCAGGV